MVDRRLKLRESDRSCRSAYSLCRRETVKRENGNFKVYVNDKNIYPFLLGTASDSTFFPLGDDRRFERYKY